MTFWSIKSSCSISPVLQSTLLINTASFGVFQYEFLPDCYREVFWLMNGQDKGSRATNEAIAEILIQSGDGC